MAAYTSNAAYDLSRFEAPERPRLEVVKPQKPKPFSITRAWGVAPIKIILLSVLLVGVISVMLASQIALVELGDEILTLQEELETLQSEEVRLQLQLDAGLSLENVEAMAEEMGLVKMENYQVERVYLNSDDAVVVAEGTPTLLDQVGHFLEGIWHTLFG